MFEQDTAGLREAQRRGWVIGDMYMHVHTGSVQKLQHVAAKQRSQACRLRHYLPLFGHPSDSNMCRGGGAMPQQTQLSTAVVGLCTRACAVGHGLAAAAQQRRQAGLGSAVRARAHELITTAR